MMSKITTSVLAGTAALAISGTASAATVILDDFSTAFGPLVVFQPTTPSILDVAVGGAEFDLTITTTSGLAAAIGDGDVVTVNNGRNSNSLLNIDYDFAPTDFSSAAAFTIDLVDTEDNRDVSFSLFINDVFASITTANSASTLLLSTNGLDLSAVTSLTLIANAEINETEFAFDNFGFTQIPAPAALGSGLMLAAFAARRRNG